MFKGKNEPKRVVDTWRGVGHMSNLSIKLEQKRIWERGSPFSGVCMREKKRNPNFSIRSTEFCGSEFIGIITKVHLLDEGYAWVPKTWDFTEDSSEDFGKSRVSGLESVHETF